MLYTPLTISQSPERVWSWSRAMSQDQHCAQQQSSPADPRCATSTLCRAPIRCVLLLQTSLRLMSLPGTPGGYSLSH